MVVIDVARYRGWIILAARGPQSRPAAKQWPVTAPPGSPEGQPPDNLNTNLVPGATLATPPSLPLLIVTRFMRLSTFRSGSSTTDLACLLLANAHSFCGTRCSVFVLSLWMESALNFDAIFSARHPGFLGSAKIRAAYVEPQPHPVSRQPCKSSSSSSCVLPIWPCTAQRAVAMLFQYMWSLSRSSR